MANLSNTRESARQVLTKEQIQEIAEKIVAGETPNCPLCNNPLCVGSRKLLEMLGYLRFNCEYCRYVFKTSLG